LPQGVACSSASPGPKAGCWWARPGRGRSDGWASSGDSCEVFHRPSPSRLCVLAGVGGAQEIQVTNFGEMPSVLLPHGKHASLSRARRAIIRAVGGSHRCGYCHRDEAAVRSSASTMPPTGRAVGKCWGCHFKESATKKLGLRGLHRVKAQAPSRRLLEHDSASPPERPQVGRESFHRSVARGSSIPAGSRRGVCPPGDARRRPRAAGCPRVSVGLAQTSLPVLASSRRQMARLPPCQTPSCRTCGWNRRCASAVGTEQRIPSPRPEAGAGPVGLPNGVSKAARWFPSLPCGMLDTPPAHCLASGPP